MFRINPQCLPLTVIHLPTKLLSIRKIKQVKQCYLINLYQDSSEILILTIKKHEEKQDIPIIVYHKYNFTPKIVPTYITTMVLQKLIRTTFDFMDGYKLRPNIPF